MHVFKTWLIANILHPIAVVVYQLLDGQGEWKFIYGIFHLLIYSLVFSLPCLLAAGSIMWVLKRSSLDAKNKFLVWLFLCTALPAICFLFITAIILNEWALIEDIILILPATLAIFIAIVVRVKPFLHYIATSKETN